MDAIVAVMTEGLTERGWDMQILGIDPLSARMMATDPSTGVELEALGRRHAREGDFSLEDLKARLDGAEWYDGQAFADYGLSEEDIAHLRAWAQAWSDDINRRLYQAVIDEEDPP